MIDKTVSHYKILEEVGRGGMGVVYKAMDIKLERPVAIKFLPPHFSASEESKARFIQEAKTAASINHPHIMGMYEIDEYEGSTFLVMEFIEGHTLKSHIANLKSGDGIPLKQALDWATQIAQGLKAAHDKGIMHRDIKPENIMLTKDGRPKIMDFGLAKLRGSAGLTRTGASVGTFSYMAPEQMQGIAVDHRCDIWALGVVLYEMLTGELPFKADHEAALTYLIVNQEPLVPSVMDRRIPHAVDTVVKKMLEKDWDVRYKNCEELLEAFDHLGKDLETTALASKTKAIAVLPFENISAEKENDYFSDGLTEEIIANFSRLKEMRVISRTASVQYKGTKKDIKTIGRELGARYILAGSVRKHQDNLRITVEVVDAETTDQLWAETYKGTMADVFDIQEQVSKQIVEALMLKMSPSDKVVLKKRTTLNPEAFDCYLRGRNFLTNRSRKSMQLAIQLFQKAIEIDPRYGDAYAGLGEAYATLFQLFERDGSLLDKAIEACLSALMYDSGSSLAYAALALAHFHKNSFDQALSATEKSIELNPDNESAYWILGRIYHTTDRDREAVEPLLKAKKLNPDFYTVYGDLQIVYSRLGEKENYDRVLQEGLAVYRRYVSKNPEDARAHMFFATDLAQAGMKEEAKAEAAMALELSPDDPLMFYNATCFYSQLGEKAFAVDALKNALAAGFVDYEWLKRDSDLEPIRGEAGYMEVMKGK